MTRDVLWDTERVWILGLGSEYGDLSRSTRRAARIQPLTNPSREHVERLVAERRAFWQRLANRRYSQSVAALIAVANACAMGFCVATSNRVFFGAAILLGPTLGFVLYRWAVAARLRRALDDRTCTACTYDLRGPLPDPLGPNRCSECGNPWPLVPPPTREECDWFAENARRQAVT
jgi:hypothetical protein